MTTEKKTEKPDESVEPADGAALQPEENNGMPEDDQPSGSGGEGAAMAGENVDSDADSDSGPEDGMDESINSVIDELEKNEEPAENVLEEFAGNESVSVSSSERNSGDNITMLMDVEMTVRVELGRTRKSVEDILDLNPGMVIELDRKAGDNVDLFLNEKPFAEGEVTVVDGNFAIRITRLLGNL